MKKANPNAVFNRKGARLFENTLKDSEYKNWETNGITKDFTPGMIQKALNTGKVTIYRDDYNHTGKIDTGDPVSTSKDRIEKYNYENNKILSEKVNLRDIAWISPIEGYYVKNNNAKYSISDNHNQYNILSDNEQSNNQETKIIPLTENTQDKSYFKIQQEDKNTFYEIF